MSLKGVLIIWYHDLVFTLWAASCRCESQGGASAVLRQTPGHVQLDLRLHRVRGYCPQQHSHPDRNSVKFFCHTPEGQVHRLFLNVCLQNSSPNSPKMPWDTVKSHVPKNSMFLVVFHQWLVSYVLCMWMPLTEPNGLMFRWAQSQSKHSWEIKG